MRFRISDEAIERLNLPTDCKGKVYAGPSVDQGLLARFMRGEIVWIKNVAGVQDTSQFDGTEVRAVYCVLTVRRDDPKDMPRKRFEAPELLFDKMSDADFVTVPHVFTPQPDEPRACLECGSLERASFHLDPDETDPENV
jgi:hypothetical protein